jgi:membrane-associated phospholipid phosphatase
MFSRKEVLALSLVAAAGLLSYLSGLDYELARTISDRTSHGVSLFFSVEYYIAYMVLAAAFLYLKDRRAACALAASVLLLFLMQAAISEIAPRTRPPEAMPVGDWLMRIIRQTGTSSSFFSGHTASSVAVCTIYLLVGWHPLAMAILALPIIGSRIMLVQHYVSDVAGGIIFGYVTAKIVYLKVAKPK